MHISSNKPHQRVYGSGPELNRARNSSIRIPGGCPGCKVFPCNCDRSNRALYVDYKINNDNSYSVGQNLIFGVNSQARGVCTDLDVDHFHNDRFWVSGLPVETMGNELLDNRLMEIPRHTESYKHDLSINSQPSISPLNINSTTTPPLNKSSKSSPLTFFNNPIDPEIKESSGAGADNCKVSAQLEQWIKRQPYSNPELDVYPRENHQYGHIQDPPLVMNPHNQKTEVVMTQQFFPQNEAEKLVCPSPTNTYFPSQDTPESDRQTYSQKACYTQKSQGLPHKLDEWIEGGQDDGFSAKPAHTEPSVQNTPSFANSRLNYVGMCTMGNIPQLLNQEQFESQKQSSEKIPQVSYVYRTTENCESPSLIPSVEGETYSMRSRQSNRRPKLHVIIPEYSGTSSHPPNSSIDRDAPADTSQIGYQAVLDPSAYNAALDVHPLSAPLNRAHPQIPMMLYGNKSCMSYTNTGYIHPYIQTSRQRNKPLSATTSCPPKISLDLPLSGKINSPMISQRFGIETLRYSIDGRKFSTSIISPPVECSRASPDVPCSYSVTSDSPHPPSSLEFCTVQVPNTPPKCQLSSKYAVLNMASHQTQNAPRDSLDQDTTNQYQQEEYFRCKYPGCNKTFPRLYNLKSHVVCHSDSKPHKCAVCGKAFARKHDLQRHLRTIHSSERPFQCDVCRVIFTGADALRKHKTTERSSQNKVDGNKLIKPLSENGLRKQHSDCE